MSEVPVKPSKWFYGLAALVMVMGIVLFVVVIFSGIASMSKGLNQIVVPGKDTMHFEKAGSYTIFYEYVSTYNNRVYATEENLSGLECSVINKTSHEHVALLPPKTASNYSFGGRSGRSIFIFTVEQPGSYEINAYYAEGYSGPEVVLAIGSDVTMRLVGTIFGAIAIIFGSIILSAVIAIITFVKRRKARLLNENHSGVT